MVAPALVLAGAMAAKGISDHMQGSAERKDRKDQAKKLAELYADLTPAQLEAIDYGQLGEINEPELLLYDDPELLGSLGDIDYDELDPELYEALTAGPTSYKNIELDPKHRDAQNEALDALNAIIEGGGANAQEKADMARLQNQVNTADRGRREAIKQDMAMRGMSGSGLELLQQLQSSQDANQVSSQTSQDIAARNELRKLEAIMQSGELSGKIGQEDYDRQANIAKAEDYINQFNTNNKMQAVQDKAAAVNRANELNAQNAYNAALANKKANIDANMYNINNVNKMNQANIDKRNQYNKYLSEAQREREAANLALKAKTAQSQNAVKSDYLADQLAINQGKTGASGQQFSYLKDEAARKDREAADTAEGVNQLLMEYGKDRENS